MQKLRFFYSLLVIISVLCCLTTMNIFVLAVDSVVTEDMMLQKNMYFFSNYYSSEKYTDVMNIRESDNLYTTSGLYLWAENRRDEVMTDDDRIECENIVSEYITDTNDILDEPTYAYNGHFYAWYSQNYDDRDNLYWIGSAREFIKDAHSQQIDEDDICVNDIVVYWYGDENNKSYLHSAIIEKIEYIDGDIVITCVSKWGEAGLYRHNIDNVPPNYLNGSTKSVDYYRYTQGEHFLSIDEDNGESGHTFKCTAEKIDIDNEHQTCSYTTECYGEFTVTSVNSSYHRIYCPDCYYSEYASHDLYMYSAAPEDYVVKCHDCTYTVECWESPEYYGDSEDGHWVDCPCGCYSFFEPHTPGGYSSTEEGYHEIECADCGYVYTENCNYGGAEAGNSSYHFFECTYCGYERAEAHVFTYTMIANNVFKHNAYCRVCQATYEKPHNWVSVSGGYRCSNCRMPTSILPDYSSLSNEELSLLLSSMSEEELEQFIASLPEDAVVRVTAILPRDDEHLTE